MIIFTAVMFFGSLIGIGILFGTKYWEARSERFLAPSVRTHADEFAIYIKELLAQGRVEVSKLPPRFVYLSRLAIHEAALAAALGARAAERGAHRLADMVSHKHRFEKREPRSEFLKRMNEHKNGHSE